MNHADHRTPVNPICLDARLWGVAHTGIGRYIENLIANFPPEARSRLVLIINPAQENEPKLSGFHKFIARSHPYSLLSQLEIPLLLGKIRPGLLHVPHFTVPVLYPGKTIVTIHDLIKHISRGSDTTTRLPALYWIKYFGYLLVMFFAVHRSTRILVPAQYWKKEILKRYSVPEDKIIVTYEGVDRKRFSGSRQDKYSIPFGDPYIIYAGNFYPHKNIPVLLQAVKMFGGKIKLVLVGSRSVFQSKIASMVSQYQITPFVRFLHNISDAALDSLYRQSLAFVTPSLIEGFGLPGLEAMSSGTPVIAADASCLPEIYGPAAIYFDPHQPRDLYARIDSVFQNSNLRRLMINLGRKRIMEYSWAKMSLDTWKIYLSQLP